ncbi:hypothetical protein [Anaerocaecibacter muris]|uniref:hypothetical protein n=1 Tax=Anaerocaecibacter muris TaxID=2941513 RepID=UPI003F693BE0
MAELLKARLGGRSALKRCFHYDKVLGSNSGARLRQSRTSAKLTPRLRTRAFICVGTGAPFEYESFDRLQ